MTNEEYEKYYNLPQVRKIFKFFLKKNKKICPDEIKSMGCIALFRAIQKNNKEKILSIFFRYFYWEIVLFYRNISKNQKLKLCKKKYSFFYNHPLDKIIVLDVINLLKPDQRSVVNGYFFYRKNMREIALEMGISKQRVSCIFRQSLLIMKKIMGG